MPSPILQLVNFNAQVFQHSAPTLLWEILDINGDPINLSGKDLRFIAYQSDGVSQTEVFSLDSTRGEIIVTGTGNNVVNVSFPLSATDLPNFAGNYVLWDITDKIVIGQGLFQLVRVPIQDSPSA